MIDTNGFVRIKDGLVAKDVAFIRSITFRAILDLPLLSDDMKWYISKRNENVDIEHSHVLAV